LDKGHAVSKSGSGGVAGNELNSSVTVRVNNRWSLWNSLAREIRQMAMYTPD